jgi:hypothetical protein
LKESRPGRYYCGIYNARPGDCREFTPIGCQDVNTDIRHDKPIKIGPPFEPRHGRKRRTR